MFIWMKINYQNQNAINNLKWFIVSLQIIIIYHVILQTAKYIHEIIDKEKVQILIVRIKQYQCLLILLIQFIVIYIEFWIRSRRLSAADEHSHTTFYKLYETVSKIHSIHISSLICTLGHVSDRLLHYFFLLHLIQFQFSSNCAKILTKLTYPTT